MNKRQKKKFIKKNMIKLRKVHPDEGDVVILQFDPDNEYMSSGTAIVPCNVKVLDKEAAQKYCDALQRAIDKMEE